MPDPQTPPTTASRWPGQLSHLLAIWFFSGTAILAISQILAPHPIFPGVAVCLLGGGLIVIWTRFLNDHHRRMDTTAQTHREKIAALKAKLSRTEEQLAEANLLRETDQQEKNRTIDILGSQLLEVERVLTDAGDGLCVIDNEFTIRRANHAVAALFNKKQPDLVGRKCFQVWQTPFCGTDRCTLERVRNGEKKIIENCMTIQNQEVGELDLSITATPFTDGFGEGDGLIKTFRIPASDGPQKTAAARLAHNLNNTLAVVIGHTELALQTCEIDHKLHAFLTKTLQAAERSLTLVNNFDTPQKTLPATNPPQPKEKQQGTATPGGLEKILFVDDEEILATMTKEYLEEFGYRFDAETSSSTALERFKDNPDYYDLVITDQTMPEMSGIELAQKILAIRSDLPIILYTGFSSSVSRETALAAGIKTFLMKPVPAAVLAQSIRSLLDDR